MKAIATEYRGGVYRSRLEARWAAFFDIIGWQYTYEPFDANGYIPDFLIHGESPLLVEIKPAVTWPEYCAPTLKIETALSGFWNRDYLVLGASPVPYFSENASIDHPSGGLIAQFESEWGWIPDVACWHECIKCSNTNIFHNSQSFSGRPCGHYDGDSYLGLVRRGKQGLEDCWSTAGRLTQWKAPNLAGR